MGLARLALACGVFLRRPISITNPWVLLPGSFASILAHQYFAPGIVTTLCYAFFYYLFGYLLYLGHYGGGICDGSQFQGPYQRHRVIKAYIQCQSRKVRCDGKTPSCASCLTKGDDSVYKLVRKTRGPGKRCRGYMGHLSIYLKVQ
ncbi:hypothetical protein EDB80DRAFT_775146 [Ilyonectria destructans]|nr:hypothetical protein EDB80DRAFT_775146 [Ilyonectria destructans]